LGGDDIDEVEIYGFKIKIDKKLKKMFSKDVLKELLDEKNICGC